MRIFFSQFLVALLFGGANAATYGQFQDLVVLDCNGGVHLLPNTPFEANIDVRMAKKLINLAVSEVKAVAAASNATCGGALTNEVITREFVPGLESLLNYIGGPPTRLLPPASCPVGTFPRTWWDGSFIETLMFSDASESGSWSSAGPRTPFSIPLPSTCTYASYTSGAGCLMQLNEPVSGTNLQLAAAQCPGSALPYLSLSCQGPYCDSGLRPCTSIGAATECGGAASGLVCQSPQAPFVSSSTDTPQALLVNFLTAITAIGGSAELAQCGSAAVGTTGAAEVLRMVRDFVFGLWGLPAPAAAGAATTLGFCLPTTPTLTAIGNSFSSLGARGVSVSYPVVADAGGAIAACARLGCNLTWVGNGHCDMACANAACMYDGGDCGGVPVASQPADPTLPASCLAAPNASLPGLNTREVCNGLGQADSARQLQTTVTYNAGTPSAYNYSYTEPWGAYCNSGGYSSSPCSCMCPLLPGHSNPGPHCEYCQPKPVCPGTYSATTGLPVAGTPATCVVTAPTVSGLASVVQTWAGTLADGTSALSPDRMSGNLYSLPAAALTPPAAAAGALPPNTVPLLQTSCAGEFVLNAINQNLGVSVSLPHLPQFATFFSATNQYLQTCRQAALDPAASPLSAAQYWVRFGVHQLAAWGYQLTAFGPGAAAVPALGSLGSALLPDWLFIRREPLATVTPTPTATATASVSPTTAPGGGGSGWGWSYPVAAYSVSSSLRSWTQGWRIAAPDARECSLASMLAPGARRCRFSYGGLGSLLAYNGVAPSVLLHVDVQEDVCATAPEAAGAAMSTGDASHTLPVLSLWLQGDLVAPATHFKPCAADADCAGTPGFACLDLDAGLINIASSMPARAQNPLAALVYGLTNTGGLPSGSPAAFKASLRRIILGMGNLPPDAGTALSFCAPKLSAVGSNWAGWSASAYAGNACASGTDPTCIANPATVAGMAPPAIVGLYAGPASSGAAPAMVVAPPAAAVSFQVLLPGLSASSFTNAVAARLQAAVAAALAAHGLVVPPPAIRLTGIAGTSTTAGGSSRALSAVAGVAATLAVDTTQTTLAAGTSGDPAALLTTQLTSAGAGTVAAGMGATLASAGIVAAGVAGVAAAGAAGSTFPGTQTTGTISGVGAGGSSSGGSSTAAAAAGIGPIVGGVVGGVLVLAAAVAVAAVVVLRRRRGGGLRKGGGGSGGGAMPTEIHLSNPARFAHSATGV